MKYLQLISICIITFACVTDSYAANEMFAVEKDPIYGGTTYVTKDGNPAPVGLYVERLASPAASALSPPTTNYVSNPIIGQNYWGFYTEPSLNIKTYIWGTTYMGDDDTGSGFPSTGDPGFVATTTESTSTEWYGWIRALSSTTFPTAVYYKDTTPAALLDGAGFGLNMDWDAAELPITNINPAYVIEYVVDPYRDADDKALILGTVANIGGGNNQLPYEFVEIFYTNEVNGVSGASDINPDGSFAFYPVTNGLYTVFARVKLSKSPRPGFPISPEFVIETLPDTRPVVDITNEDAYVIYDVNTYSISGVNNEFVEGGMSWENITTTDTGVFDATSHWDIIGIPLAVGINEITVYGSNIYSQITNDTIFIERGDVTTGTPFVDITNVTTQVSITQTDYTVVGTNNMSVCGYVDWENQTTGETGSMPATEGWSFFTSLDIGDNTIAVSGTNALGVVAQDSIIVTRGLGTEVYLLSPPDGHLTNEVTLDLDVYFGNGILTGQRYISTNNGVTFFPYVSPVTFQSAGTYYWTAQGYDSVYNPYNSQTNELTLVTEKPIVNLLQPDDGTVLTNVFAVDLVVSFGTADMGRQLSTNNGASWFDFTPGEEVYFGNVGTYYWTARGRNADGWGYANETNELTLVATGERGVFLTSPANDVILTNPAPLFSITTVGQLNYTSIITNGSPMIQVEYPTNIYMGYGVHTWSAFGTYIQPPPIDIHAETTNTFEILDPSKPAVRLLSYKDGARVPDGPVDFDVYFLNVTDKQISTNNGTTWFVYMPTVVMPMGDYEWTARGRNGGLYYYANSTNSLTVYGIPTVDVATPNTTVTFDVETYDIEGTANSQATGGMGWNNNLTGDSGDLDAEQIWQITDIPLDVGANKITVSVTNWVGELATDSVTINRGAPGTGDPELTITTAEPTEPIEASTNSATCFWPLLEGTINTNVVSITWVNTLNTSNGTAIVQPNWSIVNIPLHYGSNTIQVTGENVDGDTDMEEFSVICIPEPSLVFLALMISGLLLRIKK